MLLVVFTGNMPLLINIRKKYHSKNQYLVIKLESIPSTLVLTRWIRQFRVNQLAGLEIRIIGVENLILLISTCQILLIQMFPKQSKATNLMQPVFQTLNGCKSKILRELISLAKRLSATTTQPLKLVNGIKNQEKMQKILMPK